MCCNNKCCNISHIANIIKAKLLCIIIKTNMCSLNNPKLLRRQANDSGLVDSDNSNDFSSNTRYRLNDDSSSASSWHDSDFNASEISSNNGETTATDSSECETEPSEDGIIFQIK